MHGFVNYAKTILIISVVGCALSAGYDKREFAHFIRIQRDDSFLNIKYSKQPNEINGLRGYGKPKLQESRYTGSKFKHKWFHGKQILFLFADFLETLQFAQASNNGTEAESK